MDTDLFDLPIPQGSSKHPPPSKPLPPLPHPLPLPVNNYLTVLEPISNDPFLVPSFPSPYLRFDTMTLPFEQASSAGSSPSFNFSYTSRRDSASSIIEFAQSLLPPSPLSTRPLTPANSVDCRLQQTVTPTSTRAAESPSRSPISKRSATPDQLHRLCSELELLKVERRDSAIFDVTQDKISVTVQPCLEQEHHSFGPTYPPPVYGELSIEPENVTGIIFHPQRRPPVQRHVPPYEEVSFIDWDDDVPRLAKVKKSLADLKAGGRARANSTPFLPATSPILSTNAISGAQVNPSDMTIMTDHNSARRFSQKHSSARPSSTVRFTKRKSLRYRRTASSADHGQPTSQPERRRTTLQSTTQTLATRKRKRSSTVGSDHSGSSSGGGGRRHRRVSFNRFTCWMKKVVKRA